MVHLSSVCRPGLVSLYGDANVHLHTLSADPHVPHQQEIRSQGQPVVPGDLAPGLHVTVVGNVCDTRLARQR